MKQMINCQKSGLLFLFIIINIESFSQITFNYETPSMFPITAKISWNKTSGVTVSTGVGISTWLGKFSIDYTRNLSEQREKTSIVYVDKIRIQKQDLLIVLRDNCDNKQDIIYKIEDGMSFDALMEGSTRIQSTNGIIIIDITDLKTLTVTLIKNETYPENRISKWETFEDGKDINSREYYEKYAETLFEYAKFIDIINDEKLDNYVNEGDNYYIQKKYEQAKNSYEKAALLGYTKAQYKVGLMYEQGLGCDKNYVKAIEWYEKAANNGNESAKNALIRIKNK